MSEVSKKYLAAAAVDVVTKEFKDRAIVYLYDLDKAIKNELYICNQKGIQPNDSIQYINAVLIFRHSLSLCRAIFADKDFYNDQLTGE